MSSPGIKWYLVVGAASIVVVVAAAVASTSSDAAVDDRTISGTIEVTPSKVVLFEPEKGVEEGHHRKAVAPPTIPIEALASKPFKEAREGVLADSIKVSEAAQRDLESAKMREGETKFQFLKRLASLERRREKNRLVLEAVQKEMFILFKSSERNWKRFKVKNFYNISVGSVIVDKTQWQVLVAIDPSKNLYFKDLTEYWISLTKQSVNMTVDSFNRLPLDERKQIVASILQFHAAKSTWMSAVPGPEKPRLFETYLAKRAAIEQRWLRLTIDYRNHKAVTWR